VLMFTTAGKTFAIARTAGSAAGSAWAKHDVDLVNANAQAATKTRQIFS
jgi:hypothetical protein